MPRPVLPFASKDVSALARSLSRELETSDRKPSHLQMLNMLARAAGYQNFQHFRAQHAAQDRLEREPAVPVAVDHLRVERVARHFDAAGMLVRWPSRESHQLLCLWVLWSRFPADEVLNDRQVKDLLNAHHLFADHALLRRALADYGLVARTDDCREYRRIEQPPPPDAAALIRHLGRRQ